MEGHLQKFMLLEDRSGSVVDKSKKGGAFRDVVSRSYSFQAIRGMLFKSTPGCRIIADTVDIVSCENNDHVIESCPLVLLRFLTEEEFNVLRAISYYHDRVHVCHPTLNGGKSRLQLGLEAKEGSVVEIYNATGEVKTGIGILKSVGPIQDSKNKRGTYFGVVLSAYHNKSESDIEHDVLYIPLHRLEFLSEKCGEKGGREVTKKEEVKEIMMEGVVKTTEETFMQNEAACNSTSQHSSPPTFPLNSESKICAMEVPLQKFMLLEDHIGSILDKRFKNKRSKDKRSYSFQAVRGMLFELRLDGSPRMDTVDIVSCENNDHIIESCPLASLRHLTEVEFNMLQAVPSFQDRVNVCTANGQNSKLELGLKAEEGSVVEVYNMTGEVKTGIGMIKTIGPIPDTRRKKGTFFGVVMLDESYQPDSSDPPKIMHIPLHRLEFMSKESAEDILNSLNSTEDSSEVNSSKEAGSIKESLEVNSSEDSSKVEKPKENKLYVGCRVVVPGLQPVECRKKKKIKLRHGTVRYIGIDLIGVELDDLVLSEAWGNYFGGKKLFDCESYKGIIVKPSELLMDNCPANNFKNCKPYAFKFVDERVAIAGTPQHMEEEAPPSFKGKKETMSKFEGEASASAEKSPPTPPPALQIPKEFLDLCECPICLNVFHNPKSLQCEHHFCEECLGELIKFDENQMPFITCPTCKSIHQFKTEDATLKTLKCHLFVKQILDRFSSLLKNDEGPTCCDQPVHWYCGDCAKHLCEKCSQKHSEPKCLIKTAVRYSRGREIVMPYCELHSMFEVEGCKTCSSVVCLFCQNKYHRDHEVCSFIDFAKEYRGYLANKIATTKENSIKMEKYLQDEGDNLREAVKRKVHIAASMLDDLVDRILRKAEDLQLQERSSLERRLRENQKLVEKCQRLQLHGHVGVIWGIPKVMQMPEKGSATAARAAAGMDKDLLGCDTEKGLLKALRNFFKDTWYKTLDESGNVVKRKLDIADVLTGYW